ncbi:MAG: thioesterase family protein [Acidimicrobiia bacterium]
MADCFFGVDGDTFVPTVLCQGPWDPGHAHGGPPSALVARAVERHEPDPGVFLSRIALDLLRPIPLAPLRVATRTIRPGKRVQIVEATLTGLDDTELVRARALRVQRVPESVATLVAPSEPHPFPGPAGSSADAPGGAPRAGIAAGVELRAAAGAFYEPGPSTYWFRLLVPLVDGEATTPVERAMVAADFGNGISQVLGDSHVFINPDLVAQFEREPAGEWIALSATTRVVPGAGALAAGVLYDETGRIGQSEQSLFVGPRG